MPITALPKHTIHLIGAAQAITTPHALIKELVDNSIDAHATSIDILISPNTLDKIEVRDNGHGIAEDDLDALGRRGYTSKLRTFEDLKSIGGVSLGFRGEALASAVQLGEVTVTTRTDGQPVASLVKLDLGGGVKSQVRASHPVGTTVSVTNFMFKIPVRKQKFEVEATKTLAKVKELLQGYALARPHIRFGLKVTKGGKGSWSFAPRPSDGIKETVSKIFDRNLAAQCIERSLTFVGNHEGTLEDSSILINPGDHQQTLKATDRFIIEAFLPKPDADLSKISFGQWISIDSRPVAHDKGTMRKISTMFKYYVKASVSGDGASVKTPFLRLNIRCPTASYDPNVEPAKDDVLLGNESLVLGSIEDLFKNVYGDGKPAISNEVQPNEVGESPDSFSLLLARMPPAIATAGPQADTTGERGCGSGSTSNLPTCEVVQDSPVTEDLSGEAAVDISDSEITILDNRKRKWDFNMSTDYSQDVEDTSTNRRRLGGWGSSPRSTDTSNVLNPWLIAKMNVPIRENHEKSDEVVTTAPEACQPFLPTPGGSSSPTANNSTYKSVKQARSPLHQTRSEGTAATYLTSPQHTLEQHSIAGQLQCLNTSHLGQASTNEEEEDDGLFVGDDSDTYRRRSDFVSAGHAPVSDSTLQKLASNIQKSKGPNKPFVSPLRPGQPSVSADNLRQATLIGHMSSRQTDTSENALPEDSNDDLAWAMDYENRKDSIVRQRREQLRARRSKPEMLTVQEPPQRSPHKNRYLAAIVSLEESKSSKENEVLEKEPYQTTLPDNDPRAYLMRRQKSVLAQTSKLGGPVKLTRAKSLRLPLETVPDQEQLHNLLLKLPTRASPLAQLTATLAESDVYVSRGRQATGLIMSVLETTVLAARIETTVNRWMAANPESEFEVLFSFENLINDNVS